MVLNVLEDATVQTELTQAGVPASKPDTSLKFDGSIPEAYDTKLGPLLFEFSAADTARRVADLAPDAAKVLEIAAGTGISTEHLWQSLAPTAEIVATDLSEDMLNYARQKRGAFPNVTYQQADALELPFQDNAFDLIVCQFGIMFFTDKAKSFSEMARVLKPGGSIAFTVWDSVAHNPIAGIAQTTIETFFESDPPQFLRVPWGFSEIEPIRKLVKDAGLVDLEVEVVSKTIERPDAQDVAKGFVEGNPTVLAIRERATTDPGTVIDAVAEELKSAFGHGPLQIPLQEIFFSARKA